MNEYTKEESYETQPRLQGSGVGTRVVRSRRFMGGVRLGFLRTLGVGVGFLVRLILWMLIGSFCTSHS